MSSLTSLDIVLLTTLLWLSTKLWKSIRAGRNSSALKSPNPPSLFYGWDQVMMKSSDPSGLYTQWSEEVGLAYSLRGALGRKKLVLLDPVAVAHFYAKETITYRLSELAKTGIAGIIGKGIVWSDGEDHKRQRKILSPAFSPQAIRAVADVFYDSAHKVKAAWDNQFQIADEKELIIDVQKWMNSVSLDSIGIAGFSHDFRALDGEISTVAEVFTTALTVEQTALSFLVPMLGPFLPFLMSLPTKRAKMLWKMQDAMGEIGNQLLERSRREVANGEKGKDRSMIGTLVHAEGMEGSISGEVFMTPDEVKAQMKVLILAGYETTSISLTWLLMEMAQHPEIQEKLREEISQFSQDLTYDQLWSATAAPYLDAVVKEGLRIHAPFLETNRVCVADDVIPLYQPLTLFTGEVVDKITVTAGTSVSVPVQAMNRSRILWGEDAMEFKPERWLDGEAGIPKHAKEVQGFHHLLTFVDGQRTCLGKTFAVTEIKAVLSTLIRTYRFIERDGPDTQYDEVRFLLPRPQIVGETPGVLPLRVHRIEA